MHGQHIGLQYTSAHRQKHLVAEPLQRQLCGRSAQLIVSRHSICFGAGCCQSNHGSLSESGCMRRPCYSQMHTVGGGLHQYTLHSRMDHVHPRLAQCDMLYAEFKFRICRKTALLFEAVKKKHWDIGFSELAQHYIMMHQKFASRFVATHCRTAAAAQLSSTNTPNANISNILPVLKRSNWSGSQTSQYYNV